MKIKTNKAAGRKAVILLSGGLDSAVCLYWAKKRGFSLRALIFNYKQRHKREIYFAKKIADYAGIDKDVLNIEFPWGGSALTDKKIEVPHCKRLSAKKIPLTYVPSRNMIFLSFAFSLAESIGAENIFIGAHVEDYSGYPDCRPRFLKSFERSMNMGIKTCGIKISYPLIKYKKSQIVALGHSLGVPFKYTWSCYRGGKSPCMECESCLYRARGFKDAGLKDPLISQYKGEGA